LRFRPKTDLNHAKPSEFGTKKALTVQTEPSPQPERSASTESGKVGSRSREDQAFVQIRALKTKSTPAFELIAKKKQG